MQFECWRNVPPTLPTRLFWLMKRALRFSLRCLRGACKIVCDTALMLLRFVVGWFFAHLCGLVSRSVHGRAAVKLPVQAFLMTQKEDEQCSLRCLLG